MTSFSSRMHSSDWPRTNSGRWVTLCFLALAILLAVVSTAWAQKDVVRLSAP